MSKFNPLGINPLSYILAQMYTIVIQLRNTWYDIVQSKKKKPNTIISIGIGAIQAGGTGKTPMCILVGTMLKEMNKEIALLSRGYGRINKNLYLVPPQGAVTWKDSGDEPALFRHHFPHSWLGIGSNRVKSSQLLASKLPVHAVYILDDAFQHRQYLCNFHIVCVSPTLFEDRCIPMGYLREGFSALHRANCICIIGLKSEHQSMESVQKKLKFRYPSIPIFILFQVFDCWMDYKSRKPIPTPVFKNPLLVCGIARDYRFKTLVSELGISPGKSICFEDHHKFNDHDVNQIAALKMDGIITTEKDSFRLSTINLVNCPDICYLKIKLEFSESEQELRFRSMIKTLVSNIL